MSDIRKVVEIPINMGPAHPATHGVLRLKLKLDGEIVKEITPVIGYLHRGIEKIAETKTYPQFIPYTDRLDYVGSMIYNHGYVKGVEELLGIEVPERAEYLRVMMAELSRIASHLIWLSAWGLDLGAMAPFFYCFREREEILNLFEMICGARITFSYMRIGGVSKDMPEGFAERLQRFLDIFPEKIDEYEALLTENEIFLARTVGIGRLSREEAIDYGVTGPVARASGLNYDIRKIEPYSVYDRFDFRIPVENGCDVYSRYLVRMEEMRQSTRIVQQALDGIPEGDIMAKVPKKIKPPAGVVYSRVEGSKGEVGYLIISDGSDKPYRIKIRSPAYSNLSALPAMCKDAKIADLVATVGSIDICLGEMDR
ncbi:MAG TPA: NADH-quinone oxidoreductase subunit D [Candidatus Syntrophoarchaeum butanivorans]|uniref:NADH-quinone oxidoreductase subunit D n=1 Tax=Candidatus Syntropharchaeum butanivorans TaxID=1839936 RepID=A0A1F2P5J7_9EURY|nr:MAG: NADH:quinone oxidoreductase subunit D [Candidatus Syntrophoarchaeum butanivorans]HEC57375.1 NADH-quinone oxidoreductase subunit D [Candidatus Syntrophoarchaeum butanivorans]